MATFHSRPPGTPAEQLPPWPDAWTTGEGALPDALLTVLPSAPSRLARLSGGRNSAVYLVECGERGRFAVKRYARPGPSGLDRLEVESGALRFLEETSRGGPPAPTPKVVAVNRGSRVAVYEYMPGQPVTAPQVRDVDLALAFVDRLRGLSAQPRARFLPPAAEASFCLAELRATVARRLDRLDTVPEESPEQRAMHRFLAATVRPLAETALQQAKAAFPAPQTASLAWPQRTLSPSDFGFHNAVRAPGGGLTFLDFEYFGWDDPAKLGADFLLHPAMTLSRELRQHFARGLCALFGPSLASRLRALGPAYGVKWCLILLNEFTEPGLARRRLSGSREDRRRLQAEQLVKAERLADQAAANAVAACLAEG